MDPVLDRQKYADFIEEPLELLDPIPQAALMDNGVVMTPFQLMQPEGGGTFITHFELQVYMRWTQTAVRYSDFSPVVFEAPGVHRGMNVEPGDIAGFRLHTT